MINFINSSVETKRYRSFYHYIVIAIFAIILMPNGASAQSDEEVEEPTKVWSVFDSNSNVVGELISLNGIGDSAVVGFDIDGISFMVEVDSVRFIGSTAGVFFESDNCTGIPLIIFKDLLSPLVAVAPPGNTVYIQLTESKLPIDVVAASRRNSESGDCEKINVEGLVLAPSRPVINLSDLYTPPFSLRFVLENLGVIR